MLATASLRLSRVLPSSATTRSKVWVAAGVGCSRRRSAMMPYRLTPRFITEPGRAVQVSIARPHTLNEMGVDTKSKAVVKKPAAHPNTWVVFGGEVAGYNRDRGFFIYATPFGNYVEIEGGIRCMVSSWRRVPDQALPARAKITGSYAQAALAKSEAVESGFDEAIVLSVDGHVSEGSAENLFMLKDGAFITPPVTDDILEGVTRTLLMKVIKDELSLPVVERSIDRTEH